MLTVVMQFDTTIRGWIIVDGKFVAIHGELTAGRWCCDYSNAFMLGIVGLMHMPKYRQSHFAGCGQSIEHVIAVDQANRVKPRAPHVDRWMMQADHNVLRIRSSDGLVESLEFVIAYRAFGLIANVAIEADDQPIVPLSVITIEKRRFRERVAHQREIVVVARDAVHGQVKLCEQGPKVIVSFPTIVLDQIAGNGNDVSQPVAITIMFEHGGQRRVRHDTAKAAVFIGKQMRVCQVQNPEQNQEPLVPVVLRLERPVFFDADVLGLLVG